MIFADPKNLAKTKIQTIFPSQNANYVILDKAKTKKSKGKKISMNGLELNELEIGDSYKYLGQDEGIFHTREI